MLKVDYKDDIFAGSRKYRMIDNGDGTVSFADVTEYTQEGDLYGAGDINAANQAVNALTDGTTPAGDASKLGGVEAEAYATNDQLAGEAVYPTKAGESILLTDASDAELLGMRVCGQTKQVSTNGYQLFDASKLATTTLDAATVTNNGDGSFTVSGSGTISESTAIGFKCTHEETLELIKTAGIYYLNLGNITNPYVRITFRNADGAFAVLSGGNAESTQCEVTEEMLADESFYVYFTFYAASGSAIITGTVKPMLYMYGGGTWEPFTGSIPAPNPDYPQALESAGDGGSVTAKVLGKNLLRYPYGNQTATINGVTFTVNSNGSVTANGTATADANFVLASGNTDKSLMRKGVTYTYKALTSAGSGSTFYSSFTYGKHKFDYDFGSGRTFTCDEDFDYFYARICVVSGVTVNNVTFKPQLELGSTDTAYEPYTSQPLTLSTPNGLPGIQVSDESLANYTDENGQMWCCDEINLAEGYRVQRVNEYVFTGAEAIQSGTSSGVRYYSFGGLLSDAPTPSWSSTQSPGVCTHFTVLHNKTFGGMRDNTLWYSQRDFNSTTGTVAFIMSSVSSKEEATAFLTAEYESGNPVTLRYLLAEPIITPLTADEIAACKALHTNNPTTTILNDSGAGMEVTYKADEELYQEQSGSPKAEEMYLGKAETAQRAAEDALGNNIHTTYQRKDETENTYAKIDEFIPSMVAGLKTEEAIDAAYDAAHDNATYNSIYRALINHEASHSILGGGRWYLEGYKYMNDKYGWQITRSYGNNGVAFMRAKSAGAWTDWEKLVKSTDLSTVLAGYLPLDGSKALTGPLKLADEQGLLYCDVEQLYLRLRDVAGNNDNYRAILLRNATSGKDIANSLVLRSVINGGTADYNILHTGNSAPVHTGATAPTDDNAVWFVVE